MLAYLPAAQSMHMLEAVLGAYLPALHAMQEDATGPEYSPLLQDIQEVDSAGAYFPASQAMHSLALELLLARRPSSQAMHDPAISTEYWPDGQSVQEVAPAAAYCPAAQFWQARFAMYLPAPQV